ncbi:NRDE family protein [Chromobacterium alkanivorans]|uniref:NRDE family protein n=1 Tax=Chromobacterium alkanivorans TaxID=1071719 RepID=UPI00196714B6|nr:NRDE family protein [Chromobacterium alkanivorans]MBN3002319.1 NRDE family protein [Chromobacterium alkanivorans]
MCVIAFAYKTPGLGQLVLLANRDEYYARPTEPLDWWPQYQNTLGGRDAESGGSWLMVDGRGRIAAVTNIRDGHPIKAERSRGELVERFVSGDEDPFAFADWLRAEQGRYAPFNLLFGYASDLFHFHSRGGQIARVTPGIHTLSNATLDTPWFKSERLAEYLREFQRVPTEDQAFVALSDGTPAPPGQLPNTRIGSALERVLSPIFIKGRDYGTRASMLLTVSARGDMQFSELSWGLAGRETGRRRFTLRPGQPSAAPAR